MPVIDGSAGGWASQIQTSGLTHALPRDDLPVPGGEFPAPADGEEAAAGDAEARKQRVCKMVLRPQEVRGRACGEVCGGGGGEGGGGG